MSYSAGMGNRKWIVAAGVLAVLVAGATVAGGLYVQQHPSEPTADERVSACVDAAMQRMDGVDDEQLVESTRAQVRESCEARVG